MPILDEQHDFAHPVEPDTAWSESYYFNAYDPVTDTGLFTRIGVRPHEGTMDVGLSVWLPASELATVHGVRPQREMTDSDLAVAGVRYERLRPMAEWRITCDAEASVRDLAGRRPPRSARVALDLVFHALAPAVGSDGQGRAGAGASAAARASVGTGHLEQAGGWSGWIEADGVRHALGEARGDLLRVAPVAHAVGGRRTLINEGLARWTYEGRTGYGIAEYLHQLDADGRPVVPIE